MSKIIKISDPAAKVVATALRYDGVREEPGNRGVLADYCNWQLSDGDWRDFPLGLKGAPWCSSFLQQCGREALGSAWPFPRTPAMSSVPKVAAWGEERLLLRPQAAVGDFLCVWRNAGERFGHIALVTEVLPGGKVKTIEGNTNASGSHEGVGVFALTRSTGAHDVFLRWVEALPDEAGLHRRVL